MQEITYELYAPIEGAVGYKILISDNPTYIQDFEPGLEGFQPMTEERCRFLIWELVANLIGN
jgi:hypothetical protein